MSLRIYMDVHVPVAITQQLRRRGVDVLTCQEDGMRRASDDDLMRRAVALDRILVTQDDDLLRIAHQWQLRGEPFAGLVYAHQQGTSIGQCVEDLELIADCSRAEELASQVVFLPLR